VVDPIPVELTDNAYAALFDDDEEFEKFTLGDDGE
jgi:hypothetical protein